MKVTNIIPAPGPDAAGTRGERSIGAILVQSGRITLEDAERVMRLQRDEGLRFGEAAVKLGLVQQADVDFALSRQFSHPSLRRGESRVSEELVAAYGPAGPQLEALRALRTQLMLRWFDGSVERRALAVVSGERGEGRSLLAANLAIVFSQLGERTLLIDANMRYPRQHELFGLDNRAGLSALLSGRASTEAVLQRVPGLVSLSVLVAGALPPNPLELVSRPEFRQVLRELAGESDVILIDTPAAAAFSDAQAVAVRAGAALVVARNNTARMRSIRNLAESVAQSGATVVGSVLNDF